MSAPRPAPVPLPGPAAAFACPRCDGTLGPSGTRGWHACSGCGHRAASVHVTGLAQADEYLAAASRHRDWLVERIAAGDGPMVDPGDGTAAPGPGAGSSTTTQTLLLTAGGVLVSLAGLFFASVAWGLLAGPGKAALLVAVGTVLAYGAYRARAAVPAAAQTVTAISAALVATAAYGAPALGAVPDSVYGGEPLRWVVTASVLLAAGFGAGYGVTRIRAWLFAATKAVLAAAVSLGLHLADTVADPLAFTATTALLAVAAVAVAGYAGPGGPLRWSSSTVGVLLFATATASLLSWFDDDQQDRVVPYVVCGLVLAAVTAAAAYAAPWPALRRTAHGCSGALAGCALGLALATAGPDAAPGLLATTVAVAVLVGVGAVRSLSVPGLAVAAAMWCTALVVPLAVEADLTAGAISAVFAVTAAGLLGCAATGRAGAADGAVDGAAAPDWGLLAWPGGVSGVIAWCTWLEDQPRTSVPVELYAAPSALLLIVAGLVWAWRQGIRSGNVPNSSAVLLPGLLAFLVPGCWTVLSLSYAVDDDPGALVRSVAYLLLGAVMMAAGARTRLSALVVAGTVGAGMATLGHLGAVTDVLPRWVSLAAAGTLLLVVGARWEWLSQQQSSARRWVGSLR